MPIQRLNRTWVDGELWDAADDANPIGQKIDELVDQTNLNTAEIETARAGAIDLNTRINLLETSAATSAANAATSEANALTYKNQAQTYASNASISANNAAASEANALSYKNTAEVSAVNASTSEANALSYKNAAETAKTQAESARDLAQTYANNAASSAADAATSATSAANSASNAVISANAALAYLNDFKGRYYGEYSSAPTTDPFGNAINIGDVYYNSSVNKLYYWNGNTWEAWSQNADTVDTFHASQTPTANTIPVANSNGYINSWVKQGANSDLNADLVQGYNLNNMPVGIGVNQTWVDVTSSRAPDVTYTNTTGKPIMVSVFCRTTTFCNDSAVFIFVADSLVARVTPYCYATICAIVPPNATYRIFKGINVVIDTVYELR